MTRKGRATDPSSHMQRRKRLVQHSLEVSKGRFHVQFLPSPRLVTKVFNINWPSLVKAKVSTHVWLLSFLNIEFFKEGNYV